MILFQNRGNIWRASRRATAKVFDDVVRPAAVTLPGLFCDGCVC
jgi:hypothetical protein